MSLGHDTKCLRSACRVMGCELHSQDSFVSNALWWLSLRGDVTAKSYFEDASTPPGWIVKVKLHEPTESFGHASSAGENLAEALCGAVHCFEVDEAATP